jgi:hypothetical protein
MGLDSVRSVFDKLSERALVQPCLKTLNTDIIEMIMNYAEFYGDDTSAGLVSSIARGRDL